MWRLVVAAAVALAACVTNPRYAIERPQLSCDRATRVAVRTFETLGYTVTRLEPPGAGDGLVAGTKTNPDGSTSSGAARIRCAGQGAEVQPIEGAAFSDFSFSRSFVYSFTSLVQRPDVETPIQAAGVQVLLERVEPVRARLDLGGEAVVPDALLVRVTVRNATDRDVSLDAADVTLARTDAGSVAPFDVADARARLLPGAGADRVRGALLEHARVAARATLVAFLVYPRAAYRDGQVAITDVETGESDGFSVPLQ